ncbi:hypothetical protein G6F21_014240 [Rhizopus arrhizus]|nr:hypothetical protein G6F21_014240 [Rhizopus arrhizus]
MAGHHISQVRQGAQQQIQRHRPAIAEHGRMRVRRIDSFQVKLQGRAEVQVFLPELQRVVLHVGRRKGLAVMPGDAFAQLEGDGLAIGLGRP